MEAKRAQSTSETTHPIKYKIRAGTRDEGKTYESKMVALLSLRCVLTTEEVMWIASNSSNVGAFDDIVLRHGATTFLLQLKHKENPRPIPKLEFKKAKGDFSLHKYFKDVFDLKMSLDSDNEKPEFVRNLGSFSSFYFVLYTNTDVNDCEFFQETSDPALQFLNTSLMGKIYKTDISKLSDVVNPNSANNYKDIYLMTNQTSAKHIDHEIHEEIGNFVRKFNLAQVNIKDVAEKFTKYVSEWSDGRLGCYYCLTRMEILRKLCELLLSQYEINLSGKVLHNCVDNQMTIWNQIMVSNTVTLVSYDISIIKFLVEYTSREVIRYSTEPLSSWLRNLSTPAQSAFYQNHANLKWQMLKIISNRGKITAMDIYKCLWLTEMLPVLLVIKSQQNYNDVMQILKLCDYCYKVILINKSEEHISPEKLKEPIKQFFTLEDLSEEDANAVVKSAVILQGRSYATLEKLIDRSIFHLIHSNDIISILLSNFRIGNDLEPFPDYFIERRVSKVFIKFEAVETIEDEKFIIEGDCEKHFKLRNIHNFNISKFDDFHFNVTDKQTATIRNYAKENGEQALHHLRIYDEDHFEWIASFGSIEKLKPFLVHLESTFDSNILSTLSSKLTLLSGPPGIGKTTLMHYIARNAPSSKWILKIDLNSYMEYCKIRKLKISSGHLKHLKDFASEKITYNSKLSDAVFEKLSASRDVVLLLDGFDEVSVLYKREVTDMIERFYKDGYHMLLTTRPHMESHLEEKFNVFAFNLKSFSSDDQKEFLIRYFSTQDGDMNSDTYQNYIQDFSEKLLQATKRNLIDMDANFTGIPLQTKLLADVFYSDCKEFVFSKGAYTFDENFDLLQLYRNFMNNKIDILRSKFGSSSEETFILLKNLHSLHALKLLFPVHEDITTYVEKQTNFHYTNKPEEVALLQKVGIVTLDKNFNVSFVHRTFGEYIAAHWMAENFKSPDENLRDYVKTLVNERFTQNYTFLFIMFDRMVSEGCPLHLDVINGKTENVIQIVRLDADDVIVTDKCERSLLHMIGLYGRPFEPGFNSDNGMLDILNSFSADRVSAMIPDAFGYNPLDYALANYSLYIAHKLLTKFEISYININIDLSGKFHYLEYYMFGNLEALYQILVIYFASKELFLNKVDKNMLISSYCLNNLNIRKSDISKILTTCKSNVTVKEFVLSYGAVVFPWLKKDLHSLTIFGCVNELLDLIRLGAKINKQDDDLNTPLHYAVLHQNTAIVKKLLLNRADANKLNAEKNTPLHLAVSSSKCLSQYDRKIGDYLKIPFEYKISSTIIKELISKGAEVNLQNKKGNTPLHLALLYKNKYLAKLLLAKGADTKLKNRDGNNSLHLAAECGYNNVICKMLSSGVEIHETNNFGENSLHLAIINNKLSTVRLFLAKGSDLNLQDKMGNNCLHLAVSYANAKIVSEILSSTIDINQRNNYGNTPLLLAVIKNKLDIVDLLIFNKADVNFGNVHGYTSLHRAAFHGHVEILLKLLKQGANINQRNDGGSTPLILAACQNQLKVLKILISNGSDVNIQNNSGLNCLHYSVQFGHTKCVSEILATNIDINQQDNRGNSPLLVAAIYNKIDILKVLIEACNHLNVNLQDYNGNTALQHCVKYNRIEIISELMSTTIDIDKQNHDGNSPALLAADANKLDILKVLISKGANISIKNKNGHNSLHLSAYQGNNEIVHEILSHNVDINQQDNCGNTALHLSIINNKFSTLKLLISRGADVNSLNDHGDDCLRLAIKHHRNEMFSEILSGMVSAKP